MLRLLRLIVAVSVLAALFFYVTGCASSEDPKLQAQRDIARYEAQGKQAEVELVSGQRPTLMCGSWRPNRPRASRRCTRR